MPLRPPEFGYRTTAPARGSTRRWTRPFSASNASGRHEACPVFNTGQRHNPLPSEALRVFAQTMCPKGIPPEQVSRMITQNPLDLPSAQNAQIWMATALADIQPAPAQIGGYLEPSLSMPRLTRTSAALTCS